jgi:hypothetical protein
MTKSSSCDEEICQETNNLAIGSVNGPVHDHDGYQVSNNQPANFVDGQEQHYAAASNVYPMMATVPVDPFYSQYMYPTQHYYHPIPQGNMQSTSAIASNHSQMTSSFVTDPFYYYNMYHSYQYQTNIPPPPSYHPVDHRTQHHPDAVNEVENVHHSLPNNLANNVDDYDASRDDSSLPNVVFVSSAPTAMVAAMQSPPAIKQLKQNLATVQNRSQVPIENRKSIRNRRQNVHSRTRKGNKDPQTSVAPSIDGGSRKSKQKSFCSQGQPVGSSNDQIKGHEATKKKKTSVVLKIIRIKIEGASP